MSVLHAEVNLWEAYSLAYGTLPQDLLEYGQVLTELTVLDQPVASSEAS